MKITRKKRNSWKCGLLMLLIGLFFPLVATAQGAMVTGKVMDANGEAIIGATIMVKGSVNGTMTDIDGSFSLNNVNSKTDVLVFSYMGYNTKEVPCNGQASLSVVLDEDTKLLDEVVIIGYGQVRKGDATGSLTAIKADADARGFAPNAQDLLVGKVAGVNITSNGGSPTASSTIRIRGGSSLSASNDPLIIIDGVSIDDGGIGGVGNILGSINPSDIETFTILKDASATAIYGSRASNGVILITTRKGTEGKVNVNYDGNVTISTRTKEVDVMTGDEFRSFMTERFIDEDNFMEILRKMGNSNTDWQDEIFRTAVSTEHNLSIYGALKNLPYRVSFGYNDNNGILKTSGTERFTTSVSLTPQLFDKHLNVNINGKYMHMKSRFANEGAIGTAVSFDPTQSVYDEGSPYGGYFTWTGDDGKPVTNAPYNPVSLLEMTNNRSNAWNFIGNMQLDYKLHFLPELRLNLNLGMDYSESDGYTYTPANAPDAYSYGGYDQQWDQTRKNYTLEMYAQYGKDFNFLDSHFDIMGGYSWQQYNKDAYHIAQRISLFDANGNPMQISSGTDPEYNCLISYFGRLNYNVLNKYLFTFTLRNDHTSRFNKDNRSGIFPAAALAWRIADEDFLVNSKTVSDLKLRLGWGITGQQQLNMGSYPYMANYQTAVGDQANYLLGYDDNGNEVWTSVIRPMAYNTDLKWEETTTWNVGIDYGFLRNRIYGALDLYYRETKDLLNAETRTIAGTNFAERVARNIGTLENKGVEFSINAIPISNKDFTWDIGANIAYNKNEITSLTNISGDKNYNDDLSSPRKRFQVGHPAGTYFVYEQIYDDNGMPIEGLYVDQDKNGIINDQDLIPYKKSTPDYTIGLNSKLVWKAWDLSFAGHGSIGNYNYYATAAGNASLDKASIYQTSFLLNRIKDVLPTNFTTTQDKSSYYVQNASFFRIDNITLGWSFKKMAKFPINGRIYASVQNPVVITGYDGFDPEIGSGIDNSFYPRPISVLFGINLKY